MATSVQYEHMPEECIDHRFIIKSDQISYTFELSDEEPILKDRLQQFLQACKQGTQTYDLLTNTNGMRGINVQNNGLITFAVSDHDAVATARISIPAAQCISAFEACLNSL